MRTTLNISDAILAELKARAADSGRTFREVLEETLQLGLAAGRETGTKTKFRVRPHPLGLKAGFHGVSLNQLYDQLEAEQTAREGPAANDPSLRVADDSP
jgi:hypothetical protein